MRILALDSSGAACSAAIWAAGALRAHRFEAMARGQAERLMPMVLEVAGEAGVPLASIDVFAATTGPGGFTGLRIGLATLRGLALAAGQPMLGVTSFEAVAHGTTADERAGRQLVVVLESKRAELYAQAFDGNLSPASDCLALSPQDLAARFASAPVLLVGDGVERAAPAFMTAAGAPACSSLRRHPDAAVVARLAAMRAADASRMPPSPLYLRPPDVTTPAAAPSGEIAR